MAITAQKFLPQGKKGGDLAVTPKTSLIESPKDSGNIVFTIQKKIILVDDLLKGTFAEKKKRQKDEIKQKEDEKRAEQEKQTEKDKPDTGDEEDNKLVMPRLSFLDGIKNFISDVLVGWLTFNLIKFLPQIMKVLKILGPIADFLIFIGGKLLDGLVTFIDIGYKAVEGTRAFIENIFGEEGAKAFDNITGHLNKLFNVIGAIALGVLALGNESKKQRQSEIDKRTKNNKKLKERFERREKFKQQQKRIKRKKFFKKRTPKAIRKAIQRGKITAKKLTRSLKKAPIKTIKSVSKSVGDVSKNLLKTGSELAQTTTKGITTAAKTATTTAKSAVKTATTVAKTATKTATTVAKTATTTATRLGKSGLKLGLKGLKSIQKVVSPIVKKIPFIGALLDFALNYFVFKEPLGRSAFMAIGAGLGTWLGGIIGSIVPVGGTLVGAALGGYAGDKLSGALYDAIFKKKEPKEQKKKSITTIDRSNEPRTMDLLLSGKRGNIEQALYNMRVSAARGSGKPYSDMVGNPKFAGDVDLIMEHGLDKVSINGGRVTLLATANNIVPLDVNSVAKKTSNISSYDDEEETVVIKSGPALMRSDADSLLNPTKESIAPLVVGSGGGGDTEIDDAHYRGS